MLSKEKIDDFILNVEKMYNRYGMCTEVLKAQEIVLNKKDPELCYKFALTIKDSDRKALEKVVLEAKDPVICLNFVRTFLTADVQKHQDIVLDSKNPRLCLDLVKSAELYECIPEITPIIVGSQDIKLCYELARAIASISYYITYRKYTSSLEAVLNVIARGNNPKDCYNVFVENEKYIVQNSRIFDAFNQGILNGKDPKICFLFASNYGNFLDPEYITSLLNVVVEKNDIDTLYDFLFLPCIKGKNEKIIQEQIIKSKNVYYCTMLALNKQQSMNTDWIDLTSLQVVVLENGTPQECLKFISKIKGADIEAFEKVIKTDKHAYKEFKKRFKSYLKDRKDFSDMLEDFSKEKKEIIEDHQGDIVSF